MKITLVNKEGNPFKFIISEVTKILPVYMKNGTSLLIYENGKCTARLSYNGDDHKTRCMDDFELIRWGISEKDVFAISPDGIVEKD